MPEMFDFPWWPITDRKMCSSGPPITTASLTPRVLLQAEFSEHHEAQVGNEAIVKGLVDMRKYWDALEGDFRVEVSSEDGEDEKKGRTHSVNHGVGTATETSGLKSE